MVSYSNFPAISVSVLGGIGESEVTPERGTVSSEIVSEVDEHGADAELSEKKKNSDFEKFSATIFLVCCSFVGIVRLSGIGVVVFELLPY